MVAESVIKSVRNYLHVLQTQGMSISFGVLYGSHVAGNPHQWSDIDLVVVSPFFDNHDEWEDVARLWTAASQTDCHIEPISCGEREWYEDDSRAIIEIARRTGQRIDLPTAVT